MMKRFRCNGISVEITNLSYCIDTLLLMPRGCVYNFQLDPPIPVPLLDLTVSPGCRFCLNHRACRRIINDWAFNALIMHNFLSLHHYLWNARITTSCARVHRAYCTVLFPSHSIIDISSYSSHDRTKQAFQQCRFSSTLLSTASPHSSILASRTQSQYQSQYSKQQGKFRDGEWRTDARWFWCMHTPVFTPPPPITHTHVHIQRSCAARLINEMIMHAV